MQHNPARSFACERHLKSMTAAEILELRQRENELDGEVTSLDSELEANEAVPREFDKPDNVSRGAGGRFRLLDGRAAKLMDTRHSLSGRASGGPPRDS